MAKILLVEDDKSLAESYTYLLKSEGYEVEHAENGDWGVIKLKAFQPDLVLLDMLMPGSTGLDFLKQFHELDSHAKVIVMSNMDTIQTQLEASKLGAERYVIKSSMSPKELAELIRNEIGK